MTVCHEIKEKTRSLLKEKRRVIAKIPFGQSREIPVGQSDKSRNSSGPVRLIEKFQWANQINQALRQVTVMN